MAKMKKAESNVTESEIQPVIVELRVPEHSDKEFVFQMASGLSVTGFKLDPSYKPVPVSPTKEKATEFEAAHTETVLVRGTIEKSKIPELEAQPNVIKVRKDFKIAPFST